MSEIRVVAHRVDALTLAYRVTLEESLVETFRRRALVAREHGRAALEWSRPGFRALVGELRYSRAAKVYDLTRDPYYRLHIDLCGPGAVEYVSDVTGEVVDEPGWNVELVWYAETLAAWGLARVLEESKTLATSLGRVHEERLRRIDLCADVAGWEIRPDDVDRVVKRPRCGKSIASDGAEIDDLGRARSVRPGELAGPTTHEQGNPGKRRVCGISVGRGGALMMRIYDKVLELGYARESKREAEYDRWAAGGWDGIAPVTRVEFQLRGAVLPELGIRDPRAVRETVVDGNGKATGQRVVMHEGRPATLVDALPSLWATMLDWARIVVPGDGPTTRLKDDPRWALLRDVDFGAPRALPVRRWRARSAASEAQALGVALSQAGRAGELVGVKWSTAPEAYSARRAEGMLRARVLTLKVAETERIVRWLLERYGDATKANVHLAERARASRARFLRWDEEEDTRKPPRGRWPREGPALAVGPQTFHTSHAAT